MKGSLCMQRNVKRANFAQDLFSKTWLLTRTNVSSTEEKQATSTFCYLLDCGREGSTCIPSTSLSPAAGYSLSSTVPVLSLEREYWEDGVGCSAGASLHFAANSLYVDCRLHVRTALWYGQSPLSDSSIAVYGQVGYYVAVRLSPSVLVLECYSNVRVHHACA
jgi:hypothetical protein